MQILKIGLVGSEITLPTEARSMVSLDFIEKSRQGEAIDGTRKKDIIVSKKRLVWEYALVSEETKNLLLSIYNLQIENATPLSIIYTEQNGAEVNVIGYMSSLSFGALVQVDTFYYNGVTIEINQV